MTALVVVDSFTDSPFAGNPAAVVFLDSAQDEAWMQLVAAEMNLSETAFVHPLEDGWSLRWFTPTTEVDLCGHATLAAAHALWSEGRAVGDLAFRTRVSGTLTCRQVAGGIEMDFPADVPTTEEASVGLGDILGATPLEVLRGREDWLVVVADEHAVRGASPEFPALMALGSRGVVLTAQAKPGQDYDVVSRVFVPAFGIDEDPVTGSAHCLLACFWSARLGRSEIVGFQASKRGGTVRCVVDGDRVLLVGRAVTVLRGELTGTARR